MVAIYLFHVIGAVVVVLKVCNLDFVVVIYSATNRDSIARQVCSLSNMLIPLNTAFPCKPRDNTLEMLI